MSNYATESGVEKATSVNTTEFRKKIVLSSLKTDVDKLVVDKLGTFPNDLNNWKSKINRIDINKTITVPVDL